MAVAWVWCIKLRIPASTDLLFRLPAIFTAGVRPNLEGLKIIQQ